jgi:alpha-glucoside transport system permease protein
LDDERRSPERPAAIDEAMTPSRDEAPDVATAGGTAPEVADTETEREAKRRRSRTRLIAFAFLLPALILLGALVVYPILFSITRSFFSPSGDRFVGVDNYERMFTSPQTLTAIKNNLIWVVFAPSIVTAFGLIFAVLSERLRWSTAFKVAVFMPMAISFLSAGVTWRLIYEQDPGLGLANAAARSLVDVFHPPGAFPGARPSQEDVLTAQGEGYATSGTFSAGDTATLGLVAIPPQDVPPEARTASATQQTPGAISGTVWLDFTTGGGGTSGKIDGTEKGLPGVEVQAINDEGVIGSATTDDGGRFEISGLGGGSYRLALPASNFREAFDGISWLGPSLVTPAIIVAYVWIWAGFAMVVIGAGLAAIPRDVLEAARVEGANEWQVFRRVTVPLLAPVLLVVLVTLVINVLKIFDLVLVIAPGSSQRTANVIALQMWKTAFGIRDFGLGSALSVFLLLLVVPAMLFNLRRLRAERA